MSIEDRRGQLLDNKDNRWTTWLVQGRKAQVNFKGSVLYFPKFKILDREDVLRLYLFVQPSVICGNVYVSMSREQLEKLQTPNAINLIAEGNSTPHFDFSPFGFVGGFFAPFAQFQDEYFQDGLRLERAELEGINFSGAVLPSSFFNHSSLKGANFQSAMLRYSSFLAANLQGADFRSANLEQTDCARANLRGANLQNASLIQSVLRCAELQGANLQGANLLGAQLNDAQFESADLRGATIEYLDAHSANFKNADLRGASLEDANFTEASFEGADLRGASLLGILDYEANFTEAKYNSETKADIDLSERGAIYVD